MLGRWWQQQMELVQSLELLGRNHQIYIAQFNIWLFNHRPLLVGLLTPNRTVEEWRIVFWIAFVIFNVTNIVYIIWASGEVQPWNDGVLLKKSNDSASTSEDGYDAPKKMIEELKRDSIK